MVTFVTNCLVIDVRTMTVHKIYVGPSDINYVDVSTCFLKYVTGKVTSRRPYRGRVVHVTSCSVFPVQD